MQPLKGPFDLPVIEVGSVRVWLGEEVTEPVAILFFNNLSMSHKSCKWQQNINYGSRVQGSQENRFRAAIPGKPQESVAS